jgi:glycosyltransferase involved in cell wall biosynthesis
MASGRPIVASNVAAIGTAVVHGETGLLVPPDDPDRLAAALDRIGADCALRRGLGHDARMVAVADHDLATCRRRFVEAIGRAYGADDV